MARDDRPKTAPPPLRHQRADGAFELRFGQGGKLRHLFQQAPLRVLFPTPESGEPPLAAAVNCAGGLAGGDALRQEVWLEAGARATVSTAAAGKVSRGLGPETRIATRLAVGQGAVLEWIPQETVLFDGARLERRLPGRHQPRHHPPADPLMIPGEVFPAAGARVVHGFRGNVEGPL